MAFTDDITLTVCSGSGGNGVVQWHSMRGKPLGGPAGGDGGAGGDVYAEAVHDIAALGSYTRLKKVTAGDGGNGQKGSRHGKNGEDLVLYVPVGTKVIVQSITRIPRKDSTHLFEADKNQHNQSAATDPVAMYELLEVGQKVKLLSGGRGGFGNEHFKSAINRSPKEATPGQGGFCAVVQFELQLIADAGFVGTPNSGKSTLLNALTNSKAKVGNYPFTTLTPNLGVLNKKVFADIPGLIEGASAGKGLGHTFLRHIKRVNTLILCISVEREDPFAELELLKKELFGFDATLSEKPMTVVLTKADMIIDTALQEKVLAQFKVKGIQVYVVSAITGAGMDKLRSYLANM